MALELYGKFEENTPSPSFLLEELLNAFIEKERELFLSLLPKIGEKDYTNGYSRTDTYSWRSELLTASFM